VAGVNAVVVGADGTLGTLVCRELAVRGVSLRQPGDVLDRRVTEVADADAVVDVAGPRARPGLGWNDYLREHVGTTLAIARSMRKGAHLIHVSSASVYGARNETLTADAPEAPARFPNPSYAWAKLASEHAARALASERGLRLTVLRPPVVYGPGVEGGLDTLFRLASRGFALTLRPAGLRQHLVHIRLLLAAVARLIEKGAPARGVLVVADPFTLTNEALNEAVRARRPRALPVPVPLSLANAAIEKWPGFPDRDVPLKLAALGIFGLGTTFDVRPTFAALDIDPFEFARERTFDPYAEGT
jgi:nucleoside-diphosphate-sugar epimerase